MTLTVDLRGSAGVVGVGVGAGAGVVAVGVGAGATVVAGGGGGGGGGVALGCAAPPAWKDALQALTAHIVLVASASTVMVYAGVLKVFEVMRPLLVIGSAAAAKRSGLKR